MSYNEFRQFLLENPKYWADVAQKYAPDVIKIYNLSEADIKQAAIEAAVAKPEVKPEEKPKPETKKEEAPKEEKKPEGKQEEKQEKKSEEKPEGGKEEKPKTKAQKIADNLRRFAKAVRQLPAASKEDAARNVARSLRSIGQRVMLLSNEDFQEAAKFLHSKNGTKYIPSAEGWYFYNNGVILINKDVDIPGMPNVVIYHEGTHPVVNIIRNANPELYNRLINGLKEYRDKNPEKFLVVDEFVSVYNNPDLSPEQNEAKKNDEMITETVAQIASGKIDIESMPFNLKQAIIDFINTVLDKLVLTDFRLKDTSDEATFRRIATNVAIALKEGKDIERVLEREVGGYGDYFDTAPNLMGPQARMTAKQKKAIASSPVYFDNVKEFASEAQTIENKIDFKNQLMKRFEKVLPKLQKVYGDMLDPSKMDDAAKQYIVDAISQEAYDAILSHPEAIGWYNEKTKLAIEVVSLIHPEIATDRAAKGAFIFALAVTSNGNKVDANFDLAEKQYRIYKETGRFDPDAKFGAQQAGIRKGFRLVNELLDQGISMNEITDFFTTKYTVGQLKKTDKKGKFENIITGELVTEEVFGAAVLGSKIGNGFYMNLWGEYGQLTMDRWFMRTWGRVTGTLIKKDPAKVAKNKAKYEAAYQIVKKDKEAKAMLDKYLKDKSLVPTESDKKIGITKETKEALVLNKIFTSAEVRTELNKNEKINEFRKAVNNYAKNLFGEIEAPASGKQRKFIRDVFADIQKKLKTDYNIDIEMADLQAVLWYPEKILYESFKKGKTYEGIYETYKQQEAPEQTSEDITEEDDVVSGPPDYLNASIKLAQKNGISSNEIQRKLASARESLGLDTGGRDTAAGRGDSAADQRTKAAVAKFYSAEPEAQASYGRRTLRANALANATEQLATLLEETDNVETALDEFKASVEFGALTSKEVRSMIQSMDNETRAEMGASLEQAAKEKEKVEQIEEVFYDSESVDQFNQMGRLITFDEFAAGARQFEAMEDALSDIDGYDEFAEQHSGKEPVGKAIYNAVKEYLSKGVSGIANLSGKAKQFIIAAADRVRKAVFNRAALVLMAGAVAAPAVYFSSPVAYGVYQNASRFLAIEFGLNTPTEQEGMVDMSKVMVDPSEASPAKKIVINKNSKTPITFTIRGSIKDERDPTGKTRLWMYVRDADNGDLTYVAGPKKGNFDKYGKPGVSDVEGVGHFMISMEDLTTLTDNNKLGQLKKGLLAQIKANTPNNYVPTFKRISGDSVKLTFKKLSDVNNDDIVMTQLVQVSADNVNWYAKDNAKDFKKGIYALTDKDGNQINSLLFSPTKNNYNRFSGGAFYIIAETPSGIKVREMSGSLNMLKADIDAIAAKYGIPLSKIQIGAMDAGSFSAKPMARDGSTAFEDYASFNKIHLGEAASSLNIPAGGDIQQSMGSRALASVDGTTKALSYIMDDYYTSIGRDFNDESGRKSVSSHQKMRHARNRLIKKLDFDIGHLPSHTPSQKNTIRAIEYISDEMGFRGGYKTLQEISEAYYDAKNDGSNPELVDAVEKIIGTQEPQASMGNRQLPASVRDQIRDVIASEKGNVESASKKIRKILEGLKQFSKDVIDEMVAKYEERIGAKSESQYFFDYIKDNQALNKLNPMQARALLKQFRNFIISPEDLDNALDFVDKFVKNKALLDKVNQAKQSFRMLKAIVKNKKLSNADKLFLANLATPKFYLCDEAELIKLREMALNFISSRLTNAEQKYTMAEIDAAYNEAAAKRPAKERAKPTVKIRQSSRPVVELAVSDALTQYAPQLSVAADLSKMDLSKLDTEVLFRILNALKVYDETGVLFDLGQIAEMTRALNDAQVLNSNAIRTTLNKLAAGGISAKLQNVAAGANQIRRILVGGWDRNAARVTSETQTMREEVNKKFAELKIALPERFLLGAYGFLKEQSKGQDQFFKAGKLADQMNYLRDKIDNAKKYSSSPDEIRMLNHYYKGATDALVQLGVIKDVNGKWTAIDNVDIDSAVPDNVKKAWDFSQNLLKERSQQYAEAMRLYHGKDFDLIQDYWPRSFYKVGVSSGSLPQSQMDELPPMGSIDPVINKQSTDIADRNRGRDLMPSEGGFYILDGYETALNGLWDINATIHLSKDYAYSNALINKGSIVADAKTNDAVKKYLVSSISGILRDPMIFPDSRNFWERFSDTAINTITSTILNNFTQYAKQRLAGIQGFMVNKDASLRALSLMKRAMGDKAMEDALNKFFNNTSAPYASQLAYNELETKYYQGDFVSNKARGFLDKISPEWLVKANQFTQKQLLLTGYLAERGANIDFIKEAAKGFNEDALASAENFAEAANSTANRHFLPMEIKNAKAYKKWLYFLSTYTFVATAQFWNNMGILTKPGYTETQKKMAALQAVGFLGQQIAFQIVTRGMRDMLREIGQSLGLLEEEDKDEEEKNREKYWYQILAGVGIDTLVGPYASLAGDTMKYLINKTAEKVQDLTAETEEEEREKVNLLYTKSSELPGAYSVLEPLYDSADRAIRNGDEAEAWAIGLQLTGLMLKIGDLYFLSKMKVRALESIFATADGDKLLKAMRSTDTGNYKNWVSEVRGAGVPDEMLSKLTYKVGDMGYYVEASDAKKFMTIYEKSMDEYSKTIKQVAQQNNLKLSDNEIKRKAEKIAEKKAQMGVRRSEFKLPKDY
jgi:hypothetical protein